MDDFNPRVFTVMAATNTAINQEKLDWVLWIGMTRYIITALQDSGENVRKAGMSVCYFVFTNWDLFVKLLISMMLPFVVGDKEAFTFLGAN